VFQKQNCNQRQYPKKGTKTGTNCYTSTNGNDDRLKSIKKFLAYKSGQKVVSNEEFAQLVLPEIHELACFVSGYDVTVVIVYRNRASLMQSLHTQISRNRGPQKTFEEFMVSSNWYHRRTLNAELVIADYISVFGEDRMQVVDLDGVAASNTDLASAMLEVGGLDPFPKQCDFGEINTASRGGDHFPDLDTAWLNEAFSRWAKDHHNCAMPRDKDQSGQLSRSLKHLKRFGLPQKCIDLSGLRTKARSRDAECRARYGHLFHFVNSTATDLAIEKNVEHCEVDVDGMAANATWQERFEEAYNKLRQLCKEG